MAGIYIHIPFCKRKCHYCNFFSLASQKLKAPFLHALKREIAQNRSYFGNEPANTIYFGGGTPSLYRPAELQEVMEFLTPPPAPSPKREGNTSPPDPSPAENTSPPDPSPQGEGRIVSAMNMEVTLELNPEDVTEEYVDELKNTWFNRFSIGVQSFSDEDLKYLNRSHSAGQAVDAVKLLQQAGYHDISIDLIYGIPSSTSAVWLNNLEIVFSLDVPHLSAYALTVEQKTPLAWMIARHRSAPVSDELQVDQFKMLMQKANENGFLQYEISNFCKPGWHAVHNTSYWNGVPYLGLGPSAHSYNGNTRRWNVSNLSEYISGIEKEECISEEEVLTTSQKYNEYVMTSLRTMWGCNGQKIISDFGFRISDFFRKNAFSAIDRGFLTEVSGVYFLTDEGKLFADRIASDLFWTE